MTKLNSPSKNVLRKGTTVSNFSNVNQVNGGAKKTAPQMQSIAHPAVGKNTGFDYEMHNPVNYQQALNKTPPSSGKGVGY